MRQDFFNKRLGRRIVLERKKLKLTQEELAWMAPMDRTYLARIEEGRANPSVKVLYKIARKLNLRIHELFYDLT